MDELNNVLYGKSVSVGYKAEEYFRVTYEVASTESVGKAAYDIALGQSIGNPGIRNSWETAELYDKHSCIIMSVDDDSGYIDIGFPVANIDWQNDGISQLLCTIMGGQVDIDHITKCRVIDLHLPRSVTEQFLKPKFGILGIRTLTGQWEKPLLGGIVKPKTGLNPEQLLDITKQMVSGGIDFIKEDEIMANPECCPLEKRVEIIANFQAKSMSKFVYCFCINGDPHVVLDRAKLVAEGGGNGIHVNIWSGLGAYHSLRRLDLPLFLHYQKSGDKVITHQDNAFGIDWYVLCKLAALCGVDSIHTGMFGGYLSDEEEDLKHLIWMLQQNNVLPALSCGMHPGLVNYVTEHMGNNYLANVGGAIHGHPGGTPAGTRAMRQAIDHQLNCREYQQAIQTWGLKIV